MPTLTVTRTSWPSRSNGVWNGLQQAPAEQLGVGGVLDAHQHDANSSPPMRATVSTSRTQALSRAATCLQQQIARGMAEGVVDVLEAVEVEQQQGRHVAPAADAGDRLLEPLEQQDPVGQPGQGVVHGEILGPAPGLDLGGDVGRGAAVADRLAGGVEHRLAGEADRPVDAVGVLAQRDDVAERRASSAGRPDAGASGRGSRRDGTGRRSACRGSPRAACRSRAHSARR